MWFHKTGRFTVCDNWELSISIACAVHSEHLMLINCVNNMQDTRRQIRQLFFMSTQSKALNNLRLREALSGSLITPSSGSAAPEPDPRLQLSHWLHQVTKQIVYKTDLASPGHLTCLFVVRSG